jgi:hypothetical protein
MSVDIFPVEIRNIPFWHYNTKETTIYILGGWGCIILNTELTLHFWYQYDAQFPMFHAEEEKKIFGSYELFWIFLGKA